MLESYVDFQPWRYQDVTDRSFSLPPAAQTLDRAIPSVLDPAAHSRTTTSRCANGDVVRRFQVDDACARQFTTEAGLSTAVLWNAQADEQGHAPESSGLTSRYCLKDVR